MLRQGWAAVCDTENGDCLSLANDGHTEPQPHGCSLCSWIGAIWACWVGDRVDGTKDEGGEREREGERGGEREFLVFSFLTDDDD